MTTHRVKEDQNLWNFLFSVFFVLVLTGSLALVQEVNGSFPSAIAPFDALLMAFATFRITRLLVYDKIARWFRELFADTREVVRDGVVYIEVRFHGTGFRHTIYDLLQCPWCIGIWSALVVVVANLIFPWAWLVTFFLALAGAGSLLQVIANGIGWRAEALKLEAKEKERDLPL